MTRDIRRMWRNKKPDIEGAFILFVTLLNIVFLPHLLLLGIYQGVSYLKLLL